MSAYHIHIMQTKRVVLIHIHLLQLLVSFIQGKINLAPILGLDQDALGFTGR